MPPFPQQHPRAHVSVVQIASSLRCTLSGVTAFRKTQGRASTTRLSERDRIKSLRHEATELTQPADCFSLRSTKTERLNLNLAGGLCAMRTLGCVCVCAHGNFVVATLCNELEHCEHRLARWWTTVCDHFSTLFHQKHFRTSLQQCGESSARVSTLLNHCPDEGRSLTCRCGRDDLFVIEVSCRSLASTRLNHRFAVEMGAGKDGKGATRTKVQTEGRVTGTLTEWKGSFGWIEPNEPVDHPDAGKNRGRIYLAHEDVEAEISGVGAEVTFLLYTDGRGLGASQLRPASGPGARKPIEKVASSYGGKAGGKGKGKGKLRRPSGPNLPRETVSEDPVMGEVLEWKGSYGWIKLTEPVEHPSSEKNDGKIYIHKQDLVDVEELEAGALVQFVLYSDSSGLGGQAVSTL